MAKTCPQCQNQAADDAAFCASCGYALDPASGAASPAPPSQSAPPSQGAPPLQGAPPGQTAPSASAPANPSRSSVPPHRFAAARWTPADWIGGIASVVLFISLFLAWFGVSVIGVTVTASGLSAHGFLYFVMIICILEVAYLVL